MRLLRTFEKKGVKRAERVAADTGKIPCKRCGNPMHVGIGQVAKYHKACRERERAENNK